MGLESLKFLDKRDEDSLPSNNKNYAFIDSKRVSYNAHNAFSTA